MPTQMWVVMCKPEYLWRWAEGPCARVHNKAGATAVKGECGGAALPLGSPLACPPKDLTVVARLLSPALSLVPDTQDSTLPCQGTSWSINTSG